MATPDVIAEKLIPTAMDVSKIWTAREQYEAAQKTPEKDAWNKTHFTSTPWGIAFTCSKAKHERSIASAKAKGYDKHGGYTAPEPKNDLALRCFLISVIIGWDDLTTQLKRTLKNWGYSAADMETIIRDIWLQPENISEILSVIKRVATEHSAELTMEQLEKNICALLTEDVEKHDKLNSKLFTKEELLKDKVRDKMLEIVDEFLADLKEQKIEIKVDDILLIGSNASYNYTKNSDIDLHILTNTKKTSYDAEVAAAIYGAYRTLFNKQLDISLYDVPVEIFVETEDSKRVSNGIYSVKSNKWIKKPVHEDIPDYDKDALNTLVDKWEIKCKELLDDIKNDKLKDEKKVVKLLEDIYEKLRKKGVAKSEYSIENLAFKELRNKGYLDKLKEAKNELISKRLSLEERLDIIARKEAYGQLTRAAGTAPVIQDNGMFFIYNLKARDISRVMQALNNLPFVTEVSTHENGKYDFSNVLDIAMNKIPSKYYDVRGQIDETLISR